MGGKTRSQSEVSISLLECPVDEVDGLVKIMEDFARKEATSNLKKGRLRESAIFNINECIEEGRYMVVCAQKDKAAIGYVLCDKDVFFRGNNCFFILEEYVSPKQRGRKIYSKMLSTAMEQAINHGKKTVYIEVREANREKMAIAKRKGFETLKVERRGQDFYHLMKRKVSRQDL